MPDLVLSSKEFKTLSSDTRVQIIKFLSQRNFNLTELSSKLSLSAPSVKQHLEILLENDLIQSVDSEHKWKYYCLTRKGRKLVESSEASVLIVLSQFAIGLAGFLAFLSGIFGFSKILATSAADYRQPLTEVLPEATDGTMASAPAAAGSTVSETVSKGAEAIADNVGAQQGVQAAQAIPLIQEPFFQLLLIAVGAVLITVAIAWFLKSSRNAGKR